MLDQLVSPEVELLDHQKFFLVEIGFQLDLVLMLEQKPELALFVGPLKKLNGSGLTAVVFC